MLKIVFYERAWFYVLKIKNIFLYTFKILKQRIFNMHPKIGQTVRVYKRADLRFDRVSKTGTEKP